MLCEWLLFLVLDGVPPPPAIFTCIVLVATLIYLTGKSVYNYIKAGVKYLVDLGVSLLFTVNNP